MDVLIIDRASHVFLFMLDLSETGDDYVRGYLSCTIRREHKSRRSIYQLRDGVGTVNMSTMKPNIFNK